MKYNGQYAISHNRESGGVYVPAPNTDVSQRKRIAVDARNSPPFEHGLPPVRSIIGCSSTTVNVVLTALEERQKSRVRNTKDNIGKKWI